MKNESADDNEDKNTYTLVWYTFTYKTVFARKAEHQQILICVFFYIAATPVHSLRQPTVTVLNP